MCVSLAVVAVAAVWTGIYYHRTHPGQNTIWPTDNTDYADDEMPHADSLMVGKWQSQSKPRWYKAYYDDFDEQAKMFWGKEWHEDEDVMEEDLNYHGNGWFRWTKKGRVLHEYSTMDRQDIPIHREYWLVRYSNDEMIYFEPDYPKKIFRFTKVQ
jgi:hypothetical protein